MPREADRIKDLLRNADSIENLKEIWESEQEAIKGLDNLMKIHVNNLKEQRKGDFARGIFNQGAG